MDEGKLTAAESLQDRGPLVRTSTLGPVGVHVGDVLVSPVMLFRTLVFTSTVMSP